MSNETVPFKQEAIKDYLDQCITFWRKQQKDTSDEKAVYYIDAFQSVRTSLFGELLQEEW